MESTPASIHHKTHVELLGNPSREPQPSRTVRLLRRLVVWLGSFGQAIAASATPGSGREF